MKIILIFIILMFANIVNGESRPINFPGQFLITLNGFSYHLYKRDHKFDFERTRNELNTTIGLEYEFKSNNSNSIHSASCINFINSYYQNSFFCGGLYKTKDKLLFKNNYYGFKYGIASGYNYEEYISKDGSRKKSINSDTMYIPILNPSYYIRSNIFELELSCIVDPRNKQIDVLILLVKIFI